MLERWCEVDWVLYFGFWAMLANNAVRGAVEPRTLDGLVGGS